MTWPAAVFASVLVLCVSGLAFFGVVLFLMGVGAADKQIREDKATAALGKPKPRRPEQSS